MKLFTIRIYLFDELSHKLFELGMECGLVTVLRSFEGKNGIDVIKDVVVTQDVLECLIRYGLVYFPLYCYAHFEICCPQCGEVIEDSMILKEYDDHVLSGFNILSPCGYQTAVVKYKP